MAGNLEVLEARLSRGEISLQEYETLKAALDNDVASANTGKKNQVPRWVVPVVLPILLLMIVATILQDNSVSQKDLQQVGDWFNQKAAEVEEKQKSDPQLVAVIAPKVADVRPDGLTLNYVFNGRIADVSLADIDGYHAHIREVLCEVSYVRKVARSDEHAISVSIWRQDIFGDYAGPASDWNDRQLTCPD